jgi:phosphatidate phosphatase APP1
VEVEGETDFEGFFTLTLDLDGPVEPGWHGVEVELLESMAGGAGSRATAEVVVPPGDAEFAVVSDLDDTVIETRATDRLTEIRILFSNAPESRAPRPGAGPLWRALEAGPDAEGWNPFFYVSRSGWGLYDLFVRFLDTNDLPRGAMYLQDLAIIEEKSEKLGHEDHKRETITGLLEAYPDLPFVLVGDSGQEDPETYLDLVREHGARIRAVLIRDVTPPERDREVRGMIQEMVDLGVAAAAAESSVSLARAAADFDLIPDSAIDDVRRGMVGEGS